MKTNSKWKMVTAVALFSVILNGCGFLGIGDDDETPAPEIPASNGNNNNTPGANYVQIERLARPAINEGLVITNAFLNAFNAIPPSADLSAAAAPVLAEAVVVLTAVYNYATGNGLPAPLVADVAGGFLPDVMRIDTRNNVAVADWAYNSDFVIVSGTSAAAMLTGGRKIVDDVMDITLSYLLAGNPACPLYSCTIKDGVYYAGSGTLCANPSSGTNPANPGHKCLNGQTTRNGSATFPFLAAAN